MGVTFDTVGQQVKSVTTTYQVLTTDDLILADATAGAFTVTLPSPAGLFGGVNAPQPTFRVQKVDSTANAVTLATAAGSIIGNTNLTSQFQTATYIPDGGAFWYNFVSGGSNGDRVVQVALSSAQILALNATPVTLIPAMGAGTVIVVAGVTFKMVTTATAYASGGALEFRYTNASGAKVTADIAAGVVTAGAGTSYTSVAGVTTSLTNVVNSPIIVDNATAAFTTGTGTAVVGIRYNVFTL